MFVFVSTCYLKILLKAMLNASLACQRRFSAKLNRGTLTKSRNFWALFLLHPPKKLNPGFRSVILEHFSAILEYFSVMFGVFFNLEGHFFLVKNGSKVFYGSSAKNGYGRGGSRGRGCHMALPCGFAMWFCHIQDFGRRLKKWDFSRKVRSFSVT